jgi:thioesterase domain-containing protein/acyl carrier protein
MVAGTSLAPIQRGVRDATNEGGVMDRSAEEDGLERGGDLLRRVDLGLTTQLELPQSESELKLANIWQHVLGIDVIGTADDFFELGGDSFMATALAAEIEATFDVCFAPSDIINLSTIAEQARAVTPALDYRRRLPPHLIVGRTGGSKPPLFLVHGAKGFSFFHAAFLDEVGQDRPIYLFQAPGLDGRTNPLKTVEEIASAYIASMREIQPAGPYCIAGLCAGSFIALEMCNQLTEAGQTVARFILLDPRSKPRALLGKYPKSRSFTTLKNGISRRIYEAVSHIRQTWRGVPDDLENELRERTIKLRRQEAIRRRRAGEGKLAPPEERSYSPDVMLEASLQLSEALKTHIPRPFAGKAVLLVSSQRVRDTVGGASFWRNSLGSLEYRVCHGHHNDIFGAHLLETARFVRSALDAPS